MCAGWSHRSGPSLSGADQTPDCESSEEGRTTQWVRCQFSSFQPTQQPREPVAAEARGQFTCPTQRAKANESDRSWSDSNARSLTVTTPYATQSLELNQRRYWFLKPLVRSKTS